MPILELLGLIYMYSDVDCFHDSNYSKLIKIYMEFDSITIRRLFEIPSFTSNITNLIPFSLRIWNVSPYNYTVNTEYCE